MWSDLFKEIYFINEDGIEIHDLEFNQKRFIKNQDISNNILRFIKNGFKNESLDFEQIDDELPAKIEGEIQKAVARWLPYIIIHQIDTLTEGGDKSKIVVRILFTTSLDPEATTTMEVSPTTNRPTQEEIYKYGAHAGHR